MVVVGLVMVMALMLLLLMMMMMMTIGDNGGSHDDIELQLNGIFC